MQALVVDGAGVTVVASQAVVQVLATAGSKATIRGAGVGIVAVQQGQTYTLSGCTLVVGRAGIAIVTGGKVAVVYTTKDRMAAIVGTHVAVLTVDGGLALARSQDTNFRAGAGVVICTSCVIGHKLAAGSGITRIIGAGVEVITDCCGTGQTDRLVTDIADRTRVPIGAGGGGWQVEAATGGVTIVFGADVAVAAVGNRHTDTEAVQARVIDGTSAVVAAGGINGQVDTANALLTRITGAEIGVLAKGRTAGLAGTFVAEVVSRAGITVVTRGGVVQAEAASGWVAAVVCTRIGVLASCDFTGQAIPTKAAVSHGASVAVVTSAAGRAVQTTAEYIADIGSTRVVVITVGRCTAGASLSATHVGDGAGVAIVTRQAVV